MTKIIALRLEVPADDAVNVERAKSHIRALLRTEGSVAIGDINDADLVGELPTLFLGASDVKQGPGQGERAKPKPRKHAETPS